MARSLSSAYAFFQGIDDQQAYNLKQNEDERKRLAEERAQQDQAFAESNRALKLQEYAANQPIRDLAIQKAQEDLANFTNPESIAARTLGLQAASATSNSTSQAQLEKLRLTNPLDVGKAQASALGALLAQTSANSELTLERIASQANTFAKGDPILRANYADQLAVAKTTQEKQALADKIGLGVTIGDGYFTIGNSALQVPIEKLYQVVKSPSSGEDVTGNQLLARAAALTKEAVARDNAETNAAVRLSIEAKNTAAADKLKAEADATIKENNPAATSAPALPAKPNSTATATAQKPLTPAEQEQERLRFEAAARLDAIKQSSSQAEAKMLEAKTKYDLLLKSAKASPQDVQAAAYEYNKLRQLANAERAKVK
jgi:hypothetical protein